MPKPPLTRLARERDSLRQLQTSRGALTTVASVSRTDPQPDRKRDDLIVPKMPPHLKTSAVLPALASAMRASPAPLQFEPVPRIYVPILCAVKDNECFLVFRHNKVSKKFVYETAILTAAADGPDSAAESYDISDLVGIDRINCPHCRSKVGPVRCSTGHFVCTGRVDWNTMNFRCADSCGVHGIMTSGLRSITGSKHESVEARRPLYGSPSNGQARLPPPASPRLLPGRKP